MAYFGKKHNRLKKSIIVQELGYEYFGITYEQWMQDIQDYKNDEKDGIIDPVCIDENGNYYLEFNAPNKCIQKYYLDEFEGLLIGNISIEDKIRNKNNINQEFIEYLNDAKQGINNYLDYELEKDNIDKTLYGIAKKNTFVNLQNWLTDSNIDTLSPNVKSGILDTINNNEWENIVNSFRQKMNFGTGGIRGLMGSVKESIIKLKEEGIDARILKGPNTFNNIVLLLTSAGVAKFGLDRGYNKIVIGYDSRIRGWEFAKVIAELFLAYNYTVYLFDDPCPYPEVTFAIPYEKIKAHIGILISASHNDYRYNGYKLSCGNGSQFDPEEREKMYNDYIIKSITDDIKLCPINEAPKEKVFFLGGDKKIENFNYYGHENSIINIHKEHREHVKSFLLFKNMKDTNITKPLGIAYCAFHGSGRIAVPRLLQEVGFNNVKIITWNGLNELNGLFPSFCSDPGKEQQPDPGDPRAAEVAVDAFKQEFPNEWKNIDILIGTDPDADRCGVVVKVPENQRFLYDDKDYMLMPADDMWALILWFRLKYDKSVDPEKTFIVQSHTTSDSNVKLALKHKLGVINTWVGFAALSAGVRDTWEEKLAVGLYEGKKNEKDSICNIFIKETTGMDNGKRSYNISAMEQSNGFSILGSKPIDDFSLGVNGHVRDKDGTFAALLVAEIAEWAKQHGTTIYELIDEHIHLDPDIGLFITHYEPDPLDGEYPGIKGDRIKKAILRRSLGLYQFATAGGLEIGGLSVKSACIYRTGKYDAIYPVTHDFQFPDEGIRFYFDEDRLNHLTIRPSGTTNSLRFHVQLHTPVDKKNLVNKKLELHTKAITITDHIRELIGAPRNTNY